MTDDFARVFSTLRPVMASQAKRLSVKTDQAGHYVLVTKTPSPFPQHKGQPMWFGAVKVGKAYVSYHLVALYLNPALLATVSPQLKKHMQGKACFNFKTVPSPEILADLRRVTAASLDSLLSIGRSRAASAPASSGRLGKRKR